MANIWGCTISVLVHKPLTYKIEMKNTTLKQKHKEEEYCISIIGMRHQEIDFKSQFCIYHILTTILKVVPQKEVSNSFF